MIISVIIGSSFFSKSIITGIIAEIISETGSIKLSTKSMSGGKSSSIISMSGSIMLSASFSTIGIIFLIKSCILGI